MAVLSARNFELSGVYTQVATATTAGSNVSATVDSTSNFNANDFVLVGTIGEEGSEIAKITSITSATVMVLDSLGYAHAIDEPIYFLSYDQIEFGRRSSSGGATEVITTKTMDYENEDGYTSYDYPTASTSDYYVYRHKNSYTSNFSEYSPEFQIPTYYCNVEDVADYLGIDIRDDTDVKYIQVEKMIDRATREIDNRTNTSFKSNTIATTAYEYSDGLGGKETIEGETGYRTAYYFQHRPIISVTELSVTTNSDTTDAADTTWNSLTENTDYYLDKDTGRFDIVTSSYFPPKGNKRIRKAYTWGRSTIPSDIKRIATFIVIRDLMLSSAGKTIIYGREAYSQPDLMALDK